MTSYKRLLTRARCKIDRVWLHAWRQIFGFDRWHAAAPYSCRPYKRVVVETANALRPSTVVEVGCGLGDIVSRIQARERFGIDAELNVIRAARFLHPGNVHWLHGDASSIRGALPLMLQIDCLIMVNWIHSLSQEQLADVIVPLLPRLKYLLLDAIDPTGPASYRFKHDFHFLGSKTERIAETRLADEPRSLVVLKTLQ
jgi:SAM-dependent methyltransferase